MSKTLIRWTIGGSFMDPIGFEALRVSILSFKKLYPDMNYIICYNCLADKEIEQLKELSQLINIELYEQKNNELIIPPKTDHGSWKLCPPRLRPDAHELYIDNDVIVYRKNKKIDQFLNVENESIITEDIDRFYGSLDNKIPKGVNCCNGFFGIPPKYDFTTKLNESLMEINYKKWDKYHDEQALVVYTLNRDFKDKLKLIPIEEISICSLNTFRAATHGHHFVGLNRGRTNAWNHWMQSRSKIL